MKKLPQTERSVEIADSTVHSDVFITQGEDQRKRLSAEIPSCCGKRLKLAPGKNVTGKDVEPF